MRCPYIKLLQRIAHNLDVAVACLYPFQSESQFRPESGRNDKETYSELPLSNHGKLSALPTR